MEYKQLVGKANYIIPSTSITDYFEKDLLIVVRPWNNSDQLKVVIEEVSQYLSATQADLELTTPFQFVEGLSTLANKLRISALLANDRLFKTENREIYACGFEMVLLYKKNKELAWLAIGGFELQAEFDDYNKIICSNGDVLDSFNLLPPHLLGVDRTPVMQAGSVNVQNLKSLKIKSYFNKNDTIWNCDIAAF